MTTFNNRVTDRSLEESTNKSKENSFAQINSIGTKNRDLKKIDLEEANNTSTYKTTSKDILIESISNASGHGISRLTKDINIAVKILWIVLILASYGYCFYLVINTLIDYFNYSVNSNVEVLSETPITFPSIDICNLSPYSKERAESLVTALADNLSIDFKNYTNKTSRDYIIKYMLQQLEIQNRLGLLSMIESIYYDDPGVNSSQSNKKEELDLYKYSFNLDDILLDCKFKEIQCNRSNFYLYHNFYFGNCFRFNGGINNFNQKIPILSSNTPGWNYGLQLELNVSNSLLTYRSGFRIVINNQTQSLFSFPEDDGISIAPGFITNIVLSKIYHEQLPSPYNDCIGSLTDPDYKYLIDKSQLIKDMINKFKLKTYQSKICNKLCLQKYLLNKCKCVDVSWNIYLLYSDNYCIQKVDLDCLNDKEQEFYNSNGLQDCKRECPENCFETDYEAKISQSYYPTAWFLDNFFDSNSSEHQFYESGKGLILNVYFDDLSYTRVYQTPAIAADSLLGNLGGQLGLFMGISFLSLVEILELALLLIIHAIKLKKKN